MNVAAWSKFKRGAPCKSKDSESGATEAGGAGGIAIDEDMAKRACSRLLSEHRQLARDQYMPFHALYSFHGADIRAESFLEGQPG